MLHSPVYLALFLLGGSIRTPPTVVVTQVLDILDLEAPQIDAAVRPRLAQAVVDESNAEGLDPFMVLAVMRVESSFDSGATSVCGAKGLMQLRPSTAVFMAKQQGIRKTALDISKDPVLSTRLAIRYLGRLYRAYRFNIDSALMAYNAGPHRFSQARADRKIDRFRGYPRAVRARWLRFRALT